MYNITLMYLSVCRVCIYLTLGTHDFYHVIWVQNAIFGKKIQIYIGQYLLSPRSEKSRMLYMFFPIMKYLYRVTVKVEYRQNSSFDDFLKILESGGWIR